MPPAPAGPAAPGGGAVPVAGLVPGAGGEAPATARASGPRQLTNEPVQLQGSPIARALLHLASWEVVFRGMPARQGVLVIWPHTSNWDFVVAMLAKWAIGLPVTFWGKASLFRIPLFGAWLRWLGGMPVQRTTPQGAVGEMIEAMNAACREGRVMWLALAPEGTRKPAAGWRSGFYRVAAATGVPVTLAFFDFPRRRLGVDSHWQLSGDMAADFETFAARLAPYRGYRHEWAAPVRPL